MKTPTVYFSHKDISGACKGGISVLLCAAVFFLMGAPAGSREPGRRAAELTKAGDPAASRTSADRTGTLTTSEGLTVRLTPDRGSIKIITLEANAGAVVKYAVHIETDARAPLAQRLLDRYSVIAKATPARVEIKGTLPPPMTRPANSAAQYWVLFEVSVPLNYSVEVKTEAGDIETQDIGGLANLSTQGGNIRTGRIGVSGGARAASSERPVAKLETEGGHIQVLDVAGDLTAFTAGGHINARNVSGDASLHSGGGHIRAGQIGGRADLQTDGGNITVGQAGNLVSVRTGGGQIDFGEVRGSVRAQTGGGGIRIITVSGPMEVESNGGSICLTRVAGAVQAATAGGTIQAWINPDATSSGGKVSLPGASQLSSGAGDIIVFVPRNLAANIDAMVENGGLSRIDADPALFLNIQPMGNRSAGPVRATGALNGGGEVLKLRTTVGKIRLQFLDADTGLRDSLIREQRERIDRKHDSDILPVKASERGPRPDEIPGPGETSDWLESWMDKLEVALLGGLREDSG